MNETFLGKSLYILTFNERYNDVNIYTFYIST